MIRFAIVLCMLRFCSDCASLKWQVLEAKLWVKLWVHFGDLLNCNLHKINRTVIKQNQNQNKTKVTKRAKEKDAQAKSWDNSAWQTQHQGTRLPLPLNSPRGNSGSLMLPLARQCQARVGSNQHHPWSNRQGRVQLDISRAGSTANAQGVREKKNTL